jgi:hypothetical protein
MDRGQALCRSGHQVLVGAQVSLIFIGSIPAPVPGDHQFQERSADALRRRNIGTVHALPALHPDRQSSDYLPLLIHLLKIFKKGLAERGPVQRNRRRHVFTHIVFHKESNLLRHKFAMKRRAENFRVFFAGRVSFVAVRTPFSMGH